MKKLLNQLMQDHFEYSSFVTEYEKKGIENLNIESLEIYYVCVGKKECLESIIDEIKNHYL